MRVSLAIPFLCVLGLSVLAGCHSASDLTGKWSGDAPDSILPPDVNKDDINVRALLNTQLELKSDGTFEMLLVGMTYSGTVRPTASGLSLNVREMADRPLSIEMSPFEIARNPDGTLTLKPATPTTPPIILKRNETKSTESP